MKEYQIEELLKFLSDRPLQKKDGELFTNRGKELEFLRKVVKYHNFGIFGISGRNGSGKTSLINVFDVNEIKITRVVLIFRDNADSIIYNLLYSVCNDLINSKKSSELRNLAKEARKWIIEEVSILRGYNLAGGMGVIKGGFSKAENRIPRFNIFKALDYLETILKKATEAYGKYVIIIDELDKEKKEDAIKILDSLKLQILKDGLVVVLTLPLNLYNDYIRDRLKIGGEGNIENLIKDMIKLKELSSHEIKELLLKRFGHYISWLESPEILDVFADFSDGNPRDALWISQKVVIENIHEKQLKYKSAIEIVKETSKELLTNFNLTENQLKAISILKDALYTKEKLIANLKEKGFKRTTAYSIVDRLIELGILVKINDLYKISGKIKFALE